MNKTIDWTENGRCLHVQLLCCTCSACRSFNTLEKKTFSASLSRCIIAPVMIKKYIPNKNPALILSKYETNKHVANNRRH